MRGPTAVILMISGISATSSRSVLPSFVVSLYQETEVSVFSVMASRSTKKSASPSAVRSVSSAGSSTMVTVSSAAAAPMVQSERASRSARRRAVIFFIEASFWSKDSFG